MSGNCRQIEFRRQRQFARRLDRIDEKRHARQRPEFLPDAQFALHLVERRKLRAGILRHLQPPVLSARSELHFGGAPAQRREQRRVFEAAGQHPLPGHSRRVGQQVENFGAARPPDHRAVVAVRKGL